MRRIILALVVSGVAAVMTAGAEVQPGDAVDSVLASIEALNRFSDVYSARISITSESPEAAQPLRTRYTLYVRGLRSSLLICTAPKRDEGKRILLKGSAFWMYFPRAKKTIIMHPTNSLTGSLSIGDMVSPPLLDIYELEKTEPGRDGALLVTFRARGPRAPYGRVTYSYRGGQVISQQCYTRSNLLLKRISYSDFVPTEDDRSYAARVRVENAVYPGYVSVIEIAGLKRAAGFPDSYFTPEGMELAHE